MVVGMGEEDNIALLAKQCMSHDATDINNALGEMFKRLQAFRYRTDNPSDSAHLIRTVQELGAYRKGAVMRHLLTQVPCTKTIASESREFHMISLHILFVLAANKLIARFIVEEAGPLAVVANLVWAVDKLDDLPFMTEVFAEDILQLLAFSMEGLFYFARASKEFRTAVHESKNLVHKSLQQVLRKESLEALRPSPFEDQVVGHVALFMAVLAVHKDSRGWILDWGWLDLFLELFKAMPVEAMKENTGAALCLSLSALLKDTKTCQQLEAMHAFALLHPFKEKIQTCNGRIWHILEGTLRSGANLRLTVPRGKTGELMELIDPIPLPLVCLWADCKAGPETYSGEKYKACSGCSLAAYCSKEHQSLEWRRHKKTCRGPVG